MNHRFDKIKFFLKHILIVNFLLIFAGCSNQEEKNDDSKISLIKKERMFRKSSTALRVRKKMWILSI